VEVLKSPVTWNPPITDRTYSPFRYVPLEISSWKTSHPDVGSEKSSAKMTSPVAPVAPLAPVAPDPPVWMLRLQPPAIWPDEPSESSKRNRFQVPLGSAPSSSDRSSP
jgi:hypothetical protein